ncbi:hypothetical protein ACRRTK_012964 [Alexandromys fortis]
MNATATADYECVYNMALLTTLKNQKLKIIGRTLIGLVIKLAFEEFELERGYDTLTVGDAGKKLPAIKRNSGFRPSSLPFVSPHSPKEASASSEQGMKSKKEQEEEGNATDNN